MMYYFSLAHGRFLCALWYNSKAVTTTRERLLSCWKQVKLNLNTFCVSGNNCTIKHMATRGFRRNGFILHVADASSAKLAFCGHDPHADTLLQLLHLDFTLSGFL